MSDQAKKLAVEDPARLGQIVSQIIPGLGSMRTPRDFFAKFKKTAAQQAVSQAYGQARADVAQQVGNQVFQSPTMQLMRGNPARAQMRAGLPGGVAGMRASEALGPGGSYGFDDVMETMKRLRTQGYTEDEAKSGLNALLARDRAKAIEKEFLPQLTPEQATKVLATNTNYARGQRVIDLFDDPNLLKQGKEELNIPAIQQKYLSLGYNVGQSYALAADAADLEAGLFRGGNLRADIPGKAGEMFGNVRFHLGIIPSFHSELPVPTKFAGRDLPGLSPFGGSVVGQLLRKSIKGGPRRSANTLAAPEEEP